MAIKSIKLSGVKAGKADGLGEDGEFKLYASVFDNVDSYGDIVRKGAFGQSIKEDFIDRDLLIPVLFGHRMDDPMMNIGHVIEAVEDERGLLIHGKLDLTNPNGLQTYKMLKGKRINQASFAYDVLEYSIDEDGNRILLKLKIYEVSIVPIGANQETEVLAVKSAEAKAGRAISAKNTAKINAALDSVKTAVAALESLLATVSEVESEDGDEDPAKAGTASASEPGRDEELPSEAKSYDPTHDATAASLIAAENTLTLLAL